MLFYVSIVFVFFFSFLSTEAKKSRNSSRQPKEAASEEASETAFATFVKKAGVSLKHNGASHEIGKHTLV